MAGKKILLMGLLFFILHGCSGSDDQTVHVDFSKKMRVENVGRNRNGLLRVAVSSMTSPRQTLINYQDLIVYVSDQLVRKPQFIQRKTYREVNELLGKKQLDFAFICSGALVEAEESGIHLRILAVPVINNEANYHAVIIVRKDSPYRAFDDLLGAKFAFTDPLSHTGYRYPLYLLKLRHTTPEKFFRRTFFTYAHDYSIQAVSRGIVDAASVDELIYLYLKRVSPEKVKNIRILHRSEPFGMPPVVSPAGLHPKLDRQIQQILLHMHKTERGKSILNMLGIQRFTTADSTSYESVRKIYRMTRSIKSAL